MDATCNDYSGLLQRAENAATRAYAPYSNFRVGAVVQTELGIFDGCNVENASYGLCLCAERVAIFAAIAAGARKFEALAVACIDAPANAEIGERMPCGACRQVMCEFLPMSAKVIVAGAGMFSLNELLPQAFTLTAPPVITSN